MLFLQEQKTDQTRLSKLSKILKILIYNFQWKFEQAKQQSVCGERRPHIMGFAERKSSEQDPMLKVGFELYFLLQKVFFSPINCRGDQFILKKKAQQKDFEEENIYWQFKQVFNFSLQYLCTSHL